MAREPLKVISPNQQQPPSESEKVVSASNRPNSGGVMPARSVLNYQNDGIINALENTPSSTRGSRRRPTLLKYPLEIGSGQFPHVMQFKIFWRFEAKELRDAKAESEKNVQVLSTMKDLIDSGTFNPDGLQMASLDEQTTAALQEVLYNKKLLKTVNPAMNQDLATMLQSDPAGARSLIEQTISSYQYRVASLDQEISSDGGAVTLDEDERMQVNSRLNNVLEETSGLEAGTKAGLLAAASTLVAGKVSGKSWKSAAKTAVKAGVATGVATGLGIELLKKMQNQPKYDQMVSIYLPMCTKIGNEDTFVYEEASAAAVSGLLDAANQTTDSIAQGTVAGAIYAANQAEQGGALAAVSGLVLNPRLEKVFKQKDFRSFNFSWEFYPRTPDEAQYIRDIIETFRYHSNPSYDEQVIGQEPSKAKIILRAPAEFTVKFMSTNSNPNVAGFVENDFIPKIARCACTSITVDYSLNGLFSTFKDNSPTAVSLTLSFQEIETMTREAVDKGF